MYGRALIAETGITVLPAGIHQASRRGRRSSASANPDRLATRVMAPREGTVARGEHGRHLARAVVAYGLDEDVPGGFLISVANLGLGELAGHRKGER